MLNWLIIFLIIAVVLIVIFKSQDIIFLTALIKKYFFLLVFLAILLGVVISINSINKNYDTDYSSVKGIIKTAKIYTIWMGGIFSNIDKITGYATEQNWINNSTRRGK